jgi:hypothetical protein
MLHCGMAWPRCALMGIHVALIACGGSATGGGDQPYQRTGDAAGAPGSAGLMASAGSGVSMPPGGAGGGYGIPVGGAAGAPPIPSLPGFVECSQPSLDVTWPVLATCEPESQSLPKGYQDLRCPFSRHITMADYGPFVACCPADRPYGCANGTPWQCFATPNQAAASCGSKECITCSDPSPAGDGGASNDAGAAGSAGAF